MNNNDHIAEGDMLDHFYPHGMTHRDKFFEFGLPWIVLLVICILIAVFANVLLEGIIELSEPLSKGLGL